MPDVKSAPTRAAKELIRAKALDDWDTFDRRVQSYEAKAARKMARFYAKQSRVIAATIRSRRGKSIQKAINEYFDRSRWDTELGDEASDMFSDVIDSFGTWTMANLPTATKFDATHKRVTDYIQSRSTQAAGLVNDTTEADLRSTIDDLESQGLGVDDIAEGVEGYFADNSEYRSQLWARTETISASAYAQLEGARQSDVVNGKYWIASPDCCPICSGNVDDGTIGLSDTFSSGDDGPTSHPGCRCATGLSTDPQYGSVGSDDSDSSDDD